MLNPATGATLVHVSWYICTKIQILICEVERRMLFSNSQLQKCHDLYIPDAVCYPNGLLIK